MIVGFLGAELPRWDSLLRERTPRPTCLGLPFFEDERPLRGAAGLCDWRLGGRISLLLGARIGHQRDDRGESVRLRGSFGEKLLLPTGARLPFSRLVLYGLGPASRFDEALARQASRELIATLRQLAGPETEAPSIAIVPPGRSTGALSARRALELLLEEAEPLLDGPRPEGAGAEARLTIVESTAGQKEAAELGRRYATGQAAPGQNTPGQPGQNTPGQPGQNTTDQRTTDSPGSPSSTS